MTSPSRLTAQEARTPDEQLHDGFFARQIRTNFRILIRMIGFDRARATVAEIINSESERRSV